MLTYLANPHRFMKASSFAVPISFLAAAILIGFSIWQGLYIVPPEAVQGDSARILFVHVPAAWISMAAYMAMAGASFVWFVWRHELADIAAACIAPIGAAYTLICLATGSIWGRPTWGTWWQWDDARMVSVLILLFMYCGIMALRAALPVRQQAARACAILAMLGVINIPLIKFSVDWFTSLHQEASIIRMDGPAMSPEFLYPLLIGASGHVLLCAGLVMTAMRSDIFLRQIARQRRALLSQSI